MTQNALMTYLRMREGRSIGEQAARNFYGQGIDERRERVQGMIDTEWKKDSIRRILNVLMGRALDLHQSIRRLR